MKITTIILCALLAGCANLTPKQQRYVAIGAAVVVAGAIAAQRADRGDDAAITAACPPAAGVCRPWK